ncbi:hypothetical protein GCM10025864_00850 [Luteimicrobium album]|uniref:Uncharacterized protein n=1 Tax=Luteimicrobium album TaxID=1054550 RepID=A0ABQ6HV44_9MICO|nr:hypothetical protein GCM10025864_00850 [Luteimicrobium album]
MEASSVTNRPATALLLVAYDSQLRWAATVGAELAARGWECRYAAPSDVRSFVTPELERDLGVDVERAPWAALVRRAAGAGALVLALQGPLTSRFVQDVAAGTDPAGTDPADSDPSVARPVVVTGWVGVIVEKLVAGYLERFASDVVAVNSREDLRTFQAAGAQLGLPTDNLVLSGLPLLPGQPASPRRGPVRTVLFADQPAVPASRADRDYLYGRLVEHARRHPERRVLVKPRHRPDEDPFRTVRHHPAELLGGVDLPPNLEIMYEPFPELLRSADVVLTVSSTAGLEAVGAGVRTVFVADLGVHESLGNHVLLPSGLVRTLDVLDGPDAELPEPDPAWLRDWFVGDDDPRPPARRIVDRVVELAAVPPASARSRARRRPRRSVPGSPWRDTRRVRRQTPCGRRANAPCGPCSGARASVAGCCSRATRCSPAGGRTGRWSTGSGGPDGPDGAQAGLRPTTTVASRSSSRTTRTSASPAARNAPALAAAWRSEVSISTAPPGPSHAGASARIRRWTSSPSAPPSSATASSKRRASGGIVAIASVGT